MGRMKTLGLGLLVVLALVAVSATTASAATSATGVRPAKKEKKEKIPGAKIYEFCGSEIGCGFQFLVFSKTKEWELGGDVGGVIETVKEGKTKLTVFRYTFPELYVDGSCALIAEKTKTGYNTKGKQGAFSCPTGEFDNETWYAKK
jgi:hypothetical protein